MDRNTQTADSLLGHRIIAAVATSRLHVHGQLAMTGIPFITSKQPNPQPTCTSRDRLPARSPELEGRALSPSAGGFSLDCGGGKQEPETF